MAADRKAREASAQVKASARAEPKAKPGLTIIDAFDDPKLFEPWFAGSSWDGWRAVLKAAYALPMTCDEVTFFKSIAGDRDPPESPVSELWCICGRGAGKDSIASAICAHSAALFSESGRLRPGERALVMCLATDRDQSKIVLNYTRSFFTDIPMLASMVRRETQLGFELKNGIDIAVTTNSFRATRGRSVLCAVLDETAFWLDEGTANPDEEVLTAIKPALARLPRSLVVGISTPYRKKGLLWKKFKAHFGKPGNVLVIRATTRELNPTIDQSFVDEAIAEDPSKAKAEWLAQFRDDIGGWADFALIEQAVDFGVTVRPPLRHPSGGLIKYYSFADPGGGVRDSFTLAIAHDEDGIAVLDCVVEIQAPFNPTSAVQQIAAVLKSYGQHETTGDKYAAQWVVDAFAKVGIRYRHSLRDRSSIYLDALPLFTAGKVRLLDNKRLVAQFAGLERRTSSVGKDKVDHGPGGFDDLCNSVAGAMVAAAATPYQAPQPFFSSYGGGSGFNGSHWVGRDAWRNGGQGQPDSARYGSDPQSFWNMVSDMSERTTK